MNGAWFAGWGFMRFWEPTPREEADRIGKRGRARGKQPARHQGLPDHEGDGSDAGEVSCQASARPHTEEARHLQEITESG